MRRSIYLAGPEVFLPDPEEAAGRKKLICSEHGFEGVFPLDAALDLAGLAPRQAGLRINLANEELMRSCDLLIANLTPFRGPSADVGTAYELGYMRALGRPVYAYSNDTRSFTERTRAFLGGEDPTGMSIENFELADNLMLAGAVSFGGGEIVLGSVGEEDRFTNLDAFTECVRRAARALLER